MTKTIRMTILAATVTASMLVLGYQVAQAHTCSSVCNQVRRACNHSTKALWKSARIACAEGVETCVADCDANAATCPGDCDAARTSCEAACGDAVDPPACEAACADTHAACLDDCINCVDNCDAARDVCLADAKSARRDARDVCDGARGTCDEVCEDPIDGNCVRKCTKDEHSCRGAAKKDELDCKRDCPTGSERRVCMRTCRGEMSADLQICEDLAVLCYADCAGVDLTPPTTMGAPAP